MFEVTSRVAYDRQRDCLVLNGVKRLRYQTEFDALTKADRDAVCWFFDLTPAGVGKEMGLI